MLISVIVPVYNVENYLRKCIDSILNQTFDDFELILVDDGSPDNCGTICEEYSKKDSRIIVIHKTNGGLSDARNAGLDWVFKYSESEWITFVDSDDWIHPKYLELLYSTAVNYSVSVSVCNSVEITCRDISYDIIKESPCIKILNFENNYSNGFVHAWGKLYTKDAFKDLRYPVGIIHEDLFVTYRILFRYNQFAYIDKVLYLYFNNKEGISHSSWNLKRMDEFKGYDEQLAFLKKNKLNKPYNVCLERYLFRISEVLDKELTNLSAGKKREYEKILKKKMRKILNKYVLFSKRKDLYYHFERVYPKLSILINRIKSG